MNKLPTMNKHISLAIVLLAALALATSCDKMIDKAVWNALDNSSHGYQDSEKWGKVTVRQLPAHPFSEVKLQGSVRMEYTQADTCSIEVYGNEKAIDAYAFKTDDDELEVELKENRGRINQDTPAVTIRITAPYLTEVSGAGASEIVFTNDVEQDKELEVDLRGVGTIAIGAFKAPALELSISGAGKAILGDVRTTESTDIEVFGAGNLDGTLTSDKLKLRLTGSAHGELEIHCKRTEATVSGATSFTFKGETADFKLSTSGASHVNYDDFKVGK